MRLKKLEPGKKRLLVLGTAFLVLTLVSGIHLYRSFKTLLEMPENIPSMVYYLSPVKTIGLTFGFYSLSLFVIQTVNKYWKEWRQEKSNTS